MIFILYLLTGGGDLNEFLNEMSIIVIFLGILDLCIYIVPLVINYHVQKILDENKKMKEEINEIKNLLILQNEILRNNNNQQSIN